MTVGATSKLDTVKFQKVHSLMTGGATDGERSAARVRAEAMASKAGMTLKQAVSSLDAKPTASAPNIFAGFDDRMEEKEPGHKARQAKQRAERNARDAIRKAEILAQYGSEAAVFARTERELLLADAIAPLVTSWENWKDDDGAEHHYAKAIDGKEPKYGTWYLDEITPSIREAVENAYPWPSKLDAAVRELKAWDRLSLDRGLVSGCEWTHYAEVECRCELLTHALKAGQPAATFDDIQARFDWKRYDFERQWLNPEDKERTDPFLDRLEADFTALRERSCSAPAHPDHSGHRTTAEKRAAVLSMLDVHPELSNREIARRIGVSPQTASNWKKRLRTTADNRGAA